MEVAQTIIDCLDRGVTPVLNAPLGWGKTTYLQVILQFMLQKLNKDRTTCLTLPNIMVATDVKNSLLKTAEVVTEQEKKIVIGHNINRSYKNGDIVVQTPGYLKEGYNTIDEFQMLTHFNKGYFEDKSNWRQLFLMSATPFVPLLFAAMRAGI